MRRIRLGRTNTQVSAISLGTWAHGGPNVINGRSVGWFGTDEKLVRETLSAAHEAGINHWDTADVYGEGMAERLLGSMWEDVPRDEVFLATKVGWDQGRYDHFYHPELIREQLEGSLHNLRTDYIDLYYFHHCNFGPNDQYLEDALEVFQQARDEGKIRFIGLSDWSNEAIMRIIERVDPDVVQSYRNVLDDTFAETGLKAWSEEHDTGLAFFSPIRHGLLLGQFVGPVTFGVGDHRNEVEEFRDFGLLYRLRGCRRELRRRFADHPEPVLHGLLGMLLTDASNACVLLGQRRPAHVKAASQIGEPLSKEDAAWVKQLYERNGRPTRANWQTYQEGF